MMRSNSQRTAGARRRYPRNLLATFSVNKLPSSDNMDSDDAADVIAELPGRYSGGKYSHIEDIEQASDIAELINYEEGTAGSPWPKSW